MAASEKKSHLFQLFLLFLKEYVFFWNNIVSKCVPVFSDHHNKKKSEIRRDMLCYSFFPPRFSFYQKRPQKALNIFILTPNNFVFVYSVLGSISKLKKINYSHSCSCVWRELFFLMPTGRQFLSWIMKYNFLHVFKMGFNSALQRTHWSQTRIWVLA